MTSRALLGHGRLPVTSLFGEQIVVNFAMLQQQIKAAETARAKKETMIAGTWPSTPKNRDDVAVGDYVLVRSSAIQERGVPALVTLVSDDDSFTVECHCSQTITGVLRGRLLKYVPQVGDNVDCVHGQGVLHSIDNREFKVKVAERVHICDHLAVVPCYEPHTGYNKNQTVDLQIRTCQKELTFIDVFSGAQCYRNVLSARNRFRAVLHSYQCCRGFFEESKKK